jgi:hypothetical protein
MLLVGACGNLSQERVDNTTPTSAPSFTSVAETLTPLPTFKPGALPTLDLLATHSSPLTETPAVKPFPISPSSEKFPLDNLRMFYIMEGNLFVQDGNNSPKRLSNSQEELYPVFFCLG